MTRLTTAISTLLLAIAMQLNLHSEVFAEQSNTVESLVKRLLEAQMRQRPGRVEVSFDLTDPRQKLPRCDKVEPFLPLAEATTGRVTVGLRCIEGAVWTAYRTAVVKLYGPAVVAARSLPAGSSLASADYRMADIDVTGLKKNLITDPADLLDKTLARPLEPGQPITRELLRVKYAVSAGDQVRLSYAGGGFTVTTAGKALGSASEGQRIRVQTDNGRILSGVARENRIIEIYF
jgi:flagellar basal body P-ring formation protein FlgA